MSETNAKCSCSFTCLPLNKMRGMEQRGGESAARVKGRWEGEFYAVESAGAANDKKRRGDKD
jgi:hypothetical protein